MILDKAGKPLRKGDLVRAEFEDGIQFGIFQETFGGGLAIVELGDGSTVDTGLDYITRVGGLR